MSLLADIAKKYKVVAGEVIDFPAQSLPLKVTKAKNLATMPVFHDGKYLSIKDKENLFKAYVRFVNSDFEESKFTKGLYNHISIRFSFIAHYNLGGFYDKRFADPDGRIKTYDAIANASHWEFNDDNTSGTGDLNKAIHDFTVKNKSKFVEDAKELKKKQLIEQHKQIGDQLKDMGHDV